MDGIRSDKARVDEYGRGEHLQFCMKVYLMLLISRLRNGVLMQMDGSDMSEVPEEPRLFRT